MGIRSTLSALVSAPIAAAIEARVRALVDEALAQHDVVDAAEVRELTAAVSAARTNADALKRDIAAAQSSVAALSASLPEPGESSGGLGDALADARRKLDALSDRLIAVADQITRAEARADRAAEDASRASTLTARPPAAAPAPASKDRGCKVPGCTADHRARGFCGKHYQMWKRSTLSGFVGEDGTLFVEVDGPRWKVALALAGEPGTLDGSVVRVAGAVVDAIPAPV
jgi:hypothetical protein